jgi:hypothetical protein
VPWQQGFSFVSATPWHTRQDSPIPPTPSATYGRLRHYIAKRIRMSPIDQPLMLMKLLGRRSPAPAQDVARWILGSAWWAGFTFNGSTAYGDGHDSLIGGDALSDGERDGCLPTQAGAPTSAVCRPATATAKRAVCSVRWRAADGCCWRTRGTAW